MKPPPQTDQRAAVPPRILIAGDQLPLLYSLQALLQINGYTADLASTHQEALDKLQRQHYEQLLLDLHMTNPGGRELLEFVRQSDLDLETIVLTADPSFVSIRDALRLGAYDFVRIPYRPEELLVTVSRGLERLQIRRQLLRTERALAESERMHRFIVNNSPDFIYMLDADGIFTYVNDMVENLLGYKRHEILGQHFSCIIHPHNAEAAHRFFSEQRSGDRAPRSIEMRLLALHDDRQGQERFELLVELNAMGLYAQEDDGSRVFIGTLGSARDITERKRSEARISYQAYHDLLTRLPNRLLFDDRMAQALAHAARHQQKFALMFMDLDQFKEINDNFGHVIGDRVLQQVSERILRCVRSEDTLCRFGGDEFALLLVDVTQPEDAIAVAEKILAAVRLPLAVNDHLLQLNVSLGIAIYPEAGQTSEALLHSADIAMYHVKATGKDNYCLYHTGMGTSPAFLTVEQELAKALEKRELQVFFQPKVDPVSHMIVGMEALLRWQHPERGLLYPLDFICTAEKTRQIIAIGDWVLSTVCEELVRWRQQQLPRIKVSLNLSAVQLEEDDFVGRFVGTIKRFGLDAELFEVQVTEQGILDGQQRVVKNLRALNQLGVAVVIDDFGCGNSSLSYLRNFPVNTLMIDRAFVRDIVQEQGRQSRIADGIAMMARGLNLNLVAKGVENQLQLDHLRQLGCHEVQGYLYGEAVPASAALTLLRSRPTKGPHFTLPQ